MRAWPWSVVVLWPLVMVTRAQPSSQDTSRQFLEQLDKDDDSLISRREWNGSGATFLKFDQSRDGYLSAEELAGEKQQPVPAEEEGGLEVMEIAIGTLPRDLPGFMVDACTACHDLDRVAAARKSARGWEDTVARMQSKKEANISDAQAREIAAVLKKLRRRSAELATKFGTTQPLKEWARVFDGAELHLFDRDGNGRLNQNELVKLFWDRLDFDDDGQLSSGEVGLLPLAADRARHFEKIDRNHDGKVSVAELGAPAALLEVADGDGDGSLSVEELPRARSGPYRQLLLEDSSKVLQLLDKNRDGKLNDKEFNGSLDLIYRFDSSGDRMLDSREIEQALAFSRADGRSESFDDFMTRYDLDDDRRVDADEFVGPARAFDRLDRDHDGVVTDKDLPPGLRSPDWLSEESRRWRR